MSNRCFWFGEVMTLLSESDIDSRLVGLQGWERRGSQIERSFKLKDFAEAMTFVNRVAELAEEANHHPDIGISWNKVTLTLSTHSQGGLTQNDFDLAARINGL